MNQSVFELHFSNVVWTYWYIKGPAWHTAHLTFTQIKNLCNLAGFTSSVSVARFQEWTNFSMLFTSFSIKWFLHNHKPCYRGPL
jgi:hypothetical protein